MAEPLEAKTYTAKDGKEFIKKANKDLHIGEIKKKCNEVVSVAKDGCEAICNKMKNVEIGKEVLCVADKSLEGIVEEVEKYINSIATDAIKPVMDQVYSDAVSAFNKLQNKYNEDAKAERDAYNQTLDNQV